jgi:hypothetical protein
VTQKPVVLWVRLEIGFYSLFEYCLRVEMSLRYKQRFPGKERCLLDHLSPFWDLLQWVLQSPLSMVALTVVRDRDNEVHSGTDSC